MTRDEWLELATRCEKATGRDSLLDDAILTALDYRGGYMGDDGSPEWQKNGSYAISGPITSSLDNVTALIERELPDVTGIIPLTGGDEAWLWPKNGNPKGWRCNAATPALALCAAFCRAMAEKTTPTKDHP